ncbi:hypothetical protein PVMG_05361 [Plasmodium vivax Mauritania I]|uniref:Uncharacterized protein n=1 Tax=Plasmodium vivax Mauritania I TaxID=1035515 RepID=A0A0J9TLZ9_PLAVI|nr:hypothetical protein PVMG_05361 [Plasmodium vivax Mauritania I]
MLKTIKIIYDSYLLRDAALKHKIPSLDADDNEYSNKCISKAKGLESVTASGKSEETSSQSREDLGRNRDSSLFPRDVIDENTGNGYILELEEIEEE